MTRNPVALSLEALLDVVTEGLSVLAESGVMDADDRAKLAGLTADARRIHAEFVDDLHTVSEPKVGGDNE